MASADQKSESATLDTERAIRPERSARYRKRKAPTRRQIKANGRNSLLSTGARTPEGKRKAARNAIRHGLTSTSVLLPGDDPGERQRFADGIHRDRAPQGMSEHLFVETIVDSAWRCHRLPMIEAGALRYLAAEDTDPDLWNQTIEAFSRYRTTQERRLSRAIRDLERLQDRRRREVSLPLAERLVCAQDRLRTAEKLAGKRAEEILGEHAAMEKGKADSIQNDRSACLGSSKGDGASEPIGVVE